MCKLPATFRVPGRLVAAAFAVMLSAPALAGGLLDPPDDTGPSANDFAGWVILALIGGMRENLAERSVIQCINAGKSDHFLALQLFPANGFGAFAAREGWLTLLRREDTFTTGTDGLAGTETGTFVGRILARDGKPQILCWAWIERKSDGTVVMPLQLTPVAKPPKLKLKSK